MRFVRTLIGLALLSVVSFAQSNMIASVRTWSQGDVTRIILEFSEEAKFKHQRISKPARVFFDIPSVAVNLDTAPGKKFSTIQVNDRLIQGVRVAESQPGAVRVVFDLADDRVEYSISELANPFRIVVELRNGSRPQPELSKPLAPPVPRISVDQMRQAAEKASATGNVPTPPVAAPQLVPPAQPIAQPVGQNSSANKPQKVQESKKAAPLEKPADNLASVGAPQPASRSSRSMTRVLGLKLNKIVLDPGHGGQDFGTSSRRGLHEKELVLDIAKRLGALLEDGMGSEVVYTRTDDTFIPLEERTAFANQQKADLFVSIHANSSPYPKVAGPETFFLNFTSSKEAMNVAARENASSGKTIFELQDLVKKITLNEKLTESREFASSVQSSLREVAGKGKDRGVKRAPFVVLIGAAMPSILTEVGFLSNSQEEALLRKPAYRQKIAEALYQGISRYAQTLSHFQLATRDSTASGNDAR